MKTLSKTKTLVKTAVIASGMALMATGNVAVVKSPGGLVINAQFMTEAEAVAGRQRRTRRRGLAVGYSAGAASGAAAATAATSAAAAPAAAPAPAPAPAPVPVTQPVGAPPIGSIATTLPAGCVTSPQGGIQYFNCNGVYYRTAFQGNNLVYVVSQP